MKPLEIKTAVITPYMLEQYVYEHKNRVLTTADAFNTVPLIYRAVRLRCNALVRVPRYIYPLGSDEPIDEYPFEDTLPLRSWLWLTEAALLLRGASFTVRLMNESGRATGEIQFINPFTVSMGKSRNGSLTFKQSVDGQTREWSEEEMFYVRDYAPDSDIGFGTCPTEVALGSAQLQHYVTRFASKFFESGAMPFVALSLPPGVGKAEQDRVEGFFKRAVGGIRNAFRVVAVSGEIKPTIITPPINTLDLPGVKLTAVENVAWAFDIPKTILTADSANRATADTEYKIFTEETILPRCEFMESVLNPFLAEYGVEIAFAPEELTVMQEDENQRAEAFSTYVAAGMNRDLAAEMLGIDIPETYKGERWDEKQADPVKPDPVKPKPQLQAEAEMKKWMKKALKRLQEGKAAQVEFESDALPDELKSVTFNALAIAKSEDDVKLIFRGAR